MVGFKQLDQVQSCLSLFAHLPWKKLKEYSSALFEVLCLGLRLFAPGPGVLFIEYGQL